MKQQGTFEKHLRKSNLSENTITSYLWTVEYYHAHYDGISKENLLAYKGYLMEFYKPKTVNLRIQAINKYLINALRCGWIFPSEAVLPLPVRQPLSRL